MKKEIIVLLALFLFFMPLISAVEFDMNSSFEQGETIFAHLSGNFLTPITKDNIFFYRAGHIPIPMNYDITNINGDYYIYALTTGKTPSNDYSISIQNIKYMNGAGVDSDNIVQNFSITNSTADFSVNPGFIVTSDNFSLQVQNLLNNQITIYVQTETNSSGREIFVEGSNEDFVTVNSGEIKTINFQVGPGEPTFQEIELTTETGSNSNSSLNLTSIPDSIFCFFLGNCNQSNVTSNTSNTTSASPDEGITYEVPVYVYTGTTEISPENFYFIPSNFTLSLPMNTTDNEVVYLYNNGNTEIDNISLILDNSISPFVNISETEINSLGANSNVPIDLSLFSTTEANIDGNLTAIDENGNEASSLLSINFTNNNLTISNNSAVSNGSTYAETCAELNGTVCTSDEQCSEQPVYATDNVCCLGTCNSATQAGSSGTIIAIILIVLIIGFLLWFYLAKYKKAKKPVDFAKIAKGKKY